MTSTLPDDGAPADGAGGSSEADATTTVPVTLAPRAVGTSPLSHIQRRIWTSQRLAPEVPIANMATIHRIAGSLDPARFVDSVDRVVQASDALTSVIVDRPGEEAHARKLAEPPSSTEVVDLPAERLDEWTRQRIASAVDATVSGYDSVLLRHADDDWTWWLDLHHVVTDAWSSALVFELVSDVYTALRTGGDPQQALERLVPFHEHAVESAGSDVEGRERRRSFWTEVTTRDRRPVTPYGPRGRRTTKVTRRHVSAPDLTASARYRAISDELSILGVLCTATAVMLHRLDGRGDVVLGVPLHHRSGRAAPNVVGPLMELYPLAIDVHPLDSFGDVFDRVNRGLLAVLKHARPGESPDADFDAVVNVLTAGYGDFDGMPVRVTWMRSEHVEAAHPIRVQAYDYGLGPRIELDLNDGLSADGAHASMPGHLERTLAVMLDDPDTAIDGFDLVTDDERKVLEALNPPAPHAADHRPVHLAIAERLRADPGAVVAEEGDAVLTADELDRCADALAAWLVERGVRPGDRVGLCMPRSLDVLTAVHGVLRAGAAFVMLDPEDPPARHDVIAADAELAVILDDLPATTPGATPPARDVGPDDLAYVLYTSGSTGTPKGVPIPHRGLADYLAGAADAYATTETMVMPLHSSLVFDLTITSLFLPQLVGGRTVVFGGDPLSALSAIASDDRINVLKATPSQLELLVRLADGPLSSEVVVVGGEAFRRPLAQSIALRCPPDVRIYNEYGPTEAVVGCMLHRFDPERDTGPDVPIGRASPGAEVYVLDAARRPTPVGAWGELYVRRPGMASGYIGLPEVTAERFAAVPGVDDAALYRTGDRVRVEHDVLVYGGRIDDQLKVNGVRLEPGEIEASLVEHPDVTDAVVRIWSPRHRSIVRCARCGLGTDVPNVEVDDTGVCSVCREFDHVEPQTRSWFRTSDDLDAVRHRARDRSRGDFDCLHLLSGGKDSTYALYQLHARGWRVHALTLDNGYIADGAKANIARTVADLGISHEFVTTEAMPEIFRDSLDRFSNVCNGCYKTIYTLAVARAHELGIPVIVTGLSRGQFFETRLVPHQFESDRFDPDAIDRTVLQARRAYHRTTDAVTALLPEQAVFERDDLDVLDEIEFVDFYRYTDVELAEMYDFLAERAPWVRPDDTGRSTNCLINVVGIHVHRTERGYHNYAEPYSWDVRLGHKTREEALDELDDEVDQDEVDRILDEIDYRPKDPEILTAWYRTAGGRELDARLLAAHLRDRLPSRSIPTAFVHVTEIPLAGSAKLDVGSLPEPGRLHTGSTGYEPPATPTEAACADLWAGVLDVDRVGVHDDFFDLGGASLSALETVVAAERRFGVDLPDALVFEHRRLRDFAAAIDDAIDIGSAGAAIPPLDDRDIPPLTAGEEALLFEHRSAPDDPRYHGTRRYSIPTTGDGIDLDRLRESFATVVDRHGPLHTAFDAARTRLAIDDALSFTVVDPGTLDERAIELARLPFDLEHGPLVRVHADRTATSTDVLICLHHITADAGTFDLLWREVDLAYHGEELPELPTTVAAHGVWQRGLAEAHLPFWREYLERASADPVALPGPSSPGPDGYLAVEAPVPASELAAAAVTTPFATVLGAAAVVLGDYGVADGVSLTVAASTKDHPDVEPSIGYFLNTLPVTVDAAPRSTLRDVDRAASSAVTEILPRRSLQLADIVRDAHLRHAPVPELSWMLAYERLEPGRFGGTHADLRIVHAGGAVNDLTFLVYEHGDRLRLAIEHRGTAVGDDLARELLGRFSTAIEAMCRRPHLTVDEVRGRSDADDLIGPPLPDHAPTVVDAILDQARRRPDAAAVVDATDGTIVTYGDLVARGTTISSAIDDSVVSPQRVGVSVARSAAVVEAIVGVHLAGAAYVPLDPTMPTARRAAIVADAELDAVVADASTAGAFDGLPVIGIDRLPAPVVGSAPAPSARPDHPAYVVFTSGSTGRPAGVEVSHANLAASTAARSEYYDDPPERFLLTPSIGFDSSMVGLFWTLTAGGTIVVPGDGDVHDVDRLGAVIDRNAVTHTLMVPSLYRALLGRRPGLLGSIRTAIVAGEACDADLVAEHHRLLPSTALVNEYGPTEATVWASAHRCVPGDDPVPIGRPIAGTRLRVADRHQRPVAPGASGELLIAGPGVTIGYRSGRSNDAFVDDGHHRWYRTGDLVRVDDAGRVVFLGRLDDQLNVGGVRLEPAELESHLLRLPGVEDAAVVAADLDGRESIVAHLVGDPSSVSVAAVREHLGDLVAAAALPRHVEFHPDLPRTSHGKLDRRRVAALPIRGAAAATGAETDRLVEIWRRAIGRPDLGPDDDFFASGGDSIAAVEVVTSLGELVGHDVPVAALLSAPTPSAMAARLELTAPPASRRPELRFVTMRPGRRDGPAVVVTSAWDDVQAYRALADAFPDEVTVVAVVLDDHDDQASPLHEVGPFAAASIEPITEWWRDRESTPLVVLGWSIGGIVAQQLGHELARRGIPVTSIALVDTFFPGEDKKLWANRWDKYRVMLRPGRLGAGIREFRHLAKRRFQRYAATLGRRLLRWAGQPVEAPSVRKTRAGIPIAALDHEPVATDVPIVVFAATMTNPNRTHRRWRTVAGRLRVVPVVGRHRGFESVMGADRVHHIAEHLVETELALPAPTRG